MDTNVDFKDRCNSKNENLDVIGNSSSNSLEDCPVTFRAGITTH